MPLWPVLKNQLHLDIFWTNPLDFGLSGANKSILKPMINFGECCFMIGLKSTSPDWYSQLHRLETLHFIKSITSWFVKLFWYFKSLPLSWWVSFIGIFFHGKYSSGCRDSFFYWTSVVSSPDSYPWEHRHLPWVYKFLVLFYEL